MKRVTIFAKGNVDVHDSLHSCRVGGELKWNGINELVRADHPEISLRVRHETLTRFDALAAAQSAVPQALRDQALELGTYPLESQFSNRICTAPADAVVLSILPDVASTLVRHKAGDFLFYPAETQRWTDDQRAWLTSQFEPAPLVKVEDSMASLAAVIARIREVRDVPILVYNMSAVIPGDSVHCHLGLDETYSTRIRRFNLALIELSRATGISIVDVDAVLARHGAGRLKLDVMHLHPEGYRLIAQEVARILEELGLFETEGQA